MRQPDIYSAEAIRSWPNTECIHNVATGGDYWRPARPLGHNAFSWRWRFKLAWGVLTGKYDALRWE